MAKRLLDKITEKTALARLVDLLLQDDAARVSSNDKLAERVGTTSRNIGSYLARLHSDGSIGVEKDAATGVRRITVNK